MRNEDRTTTSQVVFSWNEPVDDGGAPIRYYTIEMDRNYDGIYT